MKSAMDFSHGGDVEGFAKALACDPSEVVDLSSNINFIKPDISIDFNSLDISSYPKYGELYDTVSKHFGVEVDECELFNGASSAIFSLFEHFLTRHCYIYSPAYLEYKKAALRFNYTFDLLNRYIDLDHEVLPNSLVVFVNPSTPDGVFYDMEKLFEKWISKECTILIDESFLDFTHYESCKKYLKSYDKLYILKSMTKFYSCAGVRIGAVLSSKKNIHKLKQTQPLWKISQFDQAYIKEVLKDSSFEKISRAVTIKNKEELTVILNGSKYIKEIFPSSANFVLVKLKGIDAKGFSELLKEYKIMVRDCSNFDFLDNSFVRIAVKGQGSLERLRKALEGF